MKTAIALIAAAGSIASADVVINEVLGSTTSTDTEFVELYNGGASAVSLDGWSIELWDSDSTSSGFGGADGFQVLDLSGFSIDAGGYFLAANDTFNQFLTANVDLAFADNGIENGSYTIILKNNGVAVNTILVSDDDGVANEAGVAVTPDLSIGPDGSFLPAGFYRVGDGSDTLALLEFSPRPAPSATPGAANIPAPAALAVLGLGGIAAGRRRR